MAQKLVRIATPKEIRKYAQVSYMDSRLKHVKEMLESDGFKLDKLGHFIIHYYYNPDVSDYNVKFYVTEIFSYSKPYGGSAANSSTNKKEKEAIFKSQAIQYLSNYKNPYLALTSPQLYHFVSRNFEDLDCKVERLQPL